MPVDPRDDRDQDDVASDGSGEDGGVGVTGELPLVVPVSDTIGAVDLGGSDEPDTPANPAPVPGADTPTDRHDLAESPTVPTPVAAGLGRSAADPTPVAGSLPVVDVGYDEPAPRRRWWPRVLLALGLVALLAVGYYAFTLWQVWSTGRSDQARPVDAIVVMGAAQYDGRPSPQLAARLDHAAALWSEGVAPTVIVTGGNQPGDRFTEAEASGTYLEELGVPSEVLRYENAGSNTYDSLVGVAEIMRAAGLEDALLVTDPYHALRSRLTAEELGIAAYVSPTPSSVVTGAAEVRRDLGEAAGVALGRIIGFDRLASLSG